MRAIEISEHMSDDLGDEPAAAAAAAAAALRAPAENCVC